MKRILFILLFSIIVSCSSTSEQSNNNENTKNSTGVIDSTNTPKTNIESTKTKLETKTKTTSSSQCLGKTKKGQRCSRMVEGGGYCYQHK